MENPKALLSMSIMKMITAFLLYLPNKFKYPNKERRNYLLEF